MATTGSLTALQLDAAAGLLQNQGIGISANLISAITAYEDTALISPFLDTISVGSTGNILSANVIADLTTLAANTCAALSNSVPPTYSGLGAQMTDVVLAEAVVDICGNNVSKLTQAVNQAQGYTDQTSVFINSAVNSQTYLGNTFTTMNNMITGSVTSINLATGPFGTDLANLGRLINLADLSNFGSPLSLVQQLYSITGTIPTLSVAFINAGISTDIALNLTSPTVSVIDSTQRLMYQAMTQITGDDLAQILTVLGVITVGITTMADLLNPLKLFPNSYQSLTAPTANGPVAIYVSSTSAVDTNLIQLLPPYVVSSLV
jgi:type IV secretory pathway VirB2 component (pilin)